MMTVSARKAVVPAFALTRIVDDHQPGSIRRKTGSPEDPTEYSYVQAPANIAGRLQAWNGFPIVLDSKCRPWSLANNYLLDRIQNETSPSMATFLAAADDLGAFRHWLDVQSNPDLMFHFPQAKLERVTYRYLGHLKMRFFGGEVASETANHHMLTVIDFYRFLTDSGYFVPNYPAWQEKQVRLSFKTDYGAVISKSVTSTDLKIKAPKASDAFRDTIQDGGQLRPLSQEEQRWFMEALKSLKNTELYLLCLFMLTTGARIQTACTLRVGHFLSESKVFHSEATGGHAVVKLACGPGTLVDTKNDKQGVLQVPLPLFVALRTYALSERAARRRAAARGGDCPEQYLFLTNRSKPYYLDKAETSSFDPARTARYSAAGGTIRKIVSTQITPYIRRHYNAHFDMKIHDLRASFGMNQTDIQLGLVEAGKSTLSKARDVVCQLMWHESAATTDRYLDYRRRQGLVFAAVNAYGEQIQRWISDAGDMGLDSHG